MERIVSGDTESFPLLQRDFVDRRLITFKSGKGGEPAPDAVRGQKTTGPAFGGHGGSVILRGRSKVESLSVLPEEDTISANAGGDGSKYSRGIHARDTVIDVPLGTIVRERVKTDSKTPEGRTIYTPRFVFQFLEDKESIVVCEGGKGGVGPQTFKKGDGRKGAHGVKKSIDLELRLINDCCLLGAPNSGKTSIISSLTSSLTRIGPEPYSTTRPHLGTLQFKDGLQVKLLDLPGIVEGDSGDKQRGARVLRHTYRSKLVLYCIDMSSGDDPFEALQTLRKELRMFDPKYFAQRRELVVATKCDMLHRDSLINLDSLFFRVRARLGPDVPVVGTSARFGLGISRLVYQIRELLYPNAVGLARPRVPADLLVNSQIQP
jgi:Obg family GTPase CgtA